NDSDRSNARHGGVSHTSIATAVLVVIALGAVAAASLFPDASHAAMDRAQTWARGLWPHAAPIAPATQTANATAEPPASNESLAAKPDAAVPPPAAPVAETPSQAPARGDPVATNTAPTPKLADAIAVPTTPPHIASPPTSFGPIASKKATDANKVGGINVKKGKANSPPLPALYSSNTLSNKAVTQRALAVPSANRAASNTHAVLPTSSAAKAGAAQTQALAQRESRPAPTQVALAA